MNVLDDFADNDIAKQQLAIFRRAASMLSSSLDFEQTLGNVIQSCLPALGDFGFFDVVLDNGVRRTVRAHLDPETEAVLRPTQWVRQTRTDMNLCALSSGEPALHAGIDDAWYRSVAVNDEHLALMSGLAFRSMLSVPMRFGNELVGSLTLFMGRSGRRHSPADLEFAAELAALAAPVVVNVRLLADDLGRRHRIEERLRLLDAVGEATRSAADPKTVMEVTTRMIGEQMRVTRCAYADLEPDNDAFTIRNDWTKPGAVSTAGTYSLNLFGPRAAGDMRQGRTLVVHDVDAELAPEEGADMFNAIGIKAIICCPLVKEGRLVAMMAVHDELPRQWSRDEVALMEDVVERCWAHIERVRSMEELRVSESHLSSLFEQSAVGIVETDTAGKLVKANGRFCELLGRSRESILGRHLREFTHPEDVSRNLLLFERLVATGEPFELEKRYVRPDGTGLWCSVSASLIHATMRGQPDLVMAVVLDITERRRVEEALRQSDRRKDEFLAMLAHELRNPLAPIASAAELLRLARTDAERVKRTNEVISRQVEHITGLVDDLLDVSRVTRGLISLDRTTLNMADIIADAVEQVGPLIESRRHHLEVQVPDAPVHVLGDNKRLVQVLTNLLNNAAKYTPEGGHIILGMETAGAEVAVRVQDNGIGMSPELRTRAFELFAQAERSSDRAQGGLGIGLALVKSLVDLHGGSIGAESEGLGLGSRFTVLLPRVEVDGGGHRTAGATAAAAADKRLRVLVVDDNVDAAAMLGMFIENMGHDVYICDRPETGLEYARQAMPEVCFIDIGLPGMDGYEMARRLRRMPLNDGTLLVALTGYGQPQDRDAARQAGFDHHFVKPMDMRQLSALLADVAAAQGKSAAA
jgi:PAS domain S-box-containing protein